MMYNKPSPLLVVWIVLKCGFRRYINRISAGFKKKPPKNDKASSIRTGTGRKRGFGGFGTGLLALVIFAYAFMIAWMMVGKIAADVRGDKASQKDAFYVSGHTLNLLDNAESRLSSASQSLQSGDISQDEFDAIEKQVQDEIRYLFLVEASIEKKLPSINFDVQEYAQKLHDQYRDTGKTYFTHEVQYKSSWAIEGLKWVGEDQLPAMVKILSLLLFLLFLAGLFGSMSGFNSELGSLEWTMEWLFTFPVNSKGIFLGRVVELAATNTFSWIYHTPLICMMLLFAGFGAFSVPLSLIFSACINLIIAMLHIVIETVLRRFFKASAIKNYQALSTILFIAFSYSAFYIGFVAEVPAWIYKFTASLPDAVYLLPTSFAAVFCFDSPLLQFGAFVGIIVVATVVVVVGLMVSGALVSRGLTTNPVVNTGKRGAFIVKRVAKGFFSGIIRKELLLLRRDRTILTQTIFVPIAIIGFNLLINKGLMSAMSTNFKSACALAFGVGTYSLLFGVINIINAEKAGIWLLFTFPTSIGSILMRKTYVWAGISFMFTLSIIAISLSTMPFPGLSAIVYIAAALIGIVIMTFITGGMAVLGSDPLATVQSRKMKPELMYMSFLLASVYAYTFMTDSYWGMFIITVLYCALAAAIWQKANDSIPWLLDPTESIPPSVTLFDGLLAVIGFFFLQSLFLLIIPQDSMSQSAELLLAYSSSGVVVFILILLIFKMRGLVDIFRQIGLVRNYGEYTETGSALKIGLVLGLLCSGIGIGYLYALDLFEPLRELKRQAMTITIEGETLWLVALTVLAAPFVEEIIFRGLVFKGLMRMMPVVPAILASAAIFAIVHPPISFVPVFVLGVASAYAYYRTNFLLASIVMHTVYNAVMMYINNT